jgi:Porin PorA
MEDCVHRVVGFVAGGLGAFFIVLALLTRFVVPGHAILFPLNEYEILHFVAHNVSYFSTSQQAERHGVTMNVTRTVEGDSVAGTSTQAVWDSYTFTYDATNQVMYTQSAQRMAFDRRSGVLISNCCGDSVDANTNVNFAGQGYVWPFGTQQRTYEVFDTTLLRPVPFRYAGTATIDGMATYKFVAHVPPTQVTSLTVPGRLVGLKTQPTVTVGEYYQATDTTWVDPVAGFPVDITENEHVTGDLGGVPRINLFQGDITMTPSTIRSAVNSAQPYNRKVNLVSTTLPLGSTVLGVILLALGVVLARSREDDKYAEAEPEFTAN